VESPAPTVNSPALSDEDPCPQTLPSSRIPAVEVEEVVSRNDTPPVSAQLAFLQEVYGRQLALTEQVRSLQKGNRRLAKKRKSLAARLEVARAREAVTLALLSRLRNAVLDAGVNSHATRDSTQAVYEALAEARLHITGGRL
jgi:hypothetical protein